MSPLPASRITWATWLIAREKDRVGFPGDAGHQRARGGPVHQAAGVPERVGGDIEGLVCAGDGAASAATVTQELAAGPSETDRSLRTNTDWEYNGAKPPASFGIKPT